MRTLFIVILSVIYTALIVGQEEAYNEDNLWNEGNRKEKRELKKQKRLEELEAKRQSVELLLDNKRFVLEASYLNGKTGQRIMVNSTLNFILIDSSNIVIQVGNNYGIGYNGLGGITLKGKINRYEITEKKKSYYLRLSTSTSLGFYDIFMSVGFSGNASATLYGIGSGNLTYTGEIKPIELSRNYVGSSF